jgi:predicted transcriptional regulator of viral defense system
LPQVHADLDEDARADVLAFTAFLLDVWRQIWSNNPTTYEQGQAVPAASRTSAAGNRIEELSPLATLHTHERSTTVSICFGSIIRSSRWALIVTPICYYLSLQEVRLMYAVDVLETLELVGSTQWGLVTTAQAHGAGVSKMQLSRLSDRGTVQRVRHGVYALPSADTGPLQGLRAAWLATGSGPAGTQPLAVVSGESAAAVHGLGDLLPSKYEFTSASRRQTTQSDTRYRKRQLPDEDVTWVDGLPVTSVARTIRDLAATGIDFDHLATAVRDAVTNTNVASEALVQALEPSAKRLSSPDGNALLITALKSAGYQPDIRGLELAFPELQEKVLRALAPQLQSVISQAFAEQLRQLVPKIDLYPVTQQFSALFPDTEAIARAFAKLPPVQLPELDPSGKPKHQTPDAARRQDRSAADDTAPGSARNESPQDVPRDEAGQ